MSVFSAARTCSGKLFQTLGATTLKARSPNQWGRHTSDEVLQQVDFQGRVVCGAGADTENVPLRLKHHNITVRMSWVRLLGHVISAMASLEVSQMSSCWSVWQRFASSLRGQHHTLTILRFIASSFTHLQVLSRDNDSGNGFHRLTRWALIDNVSRDISSVIPRDHRRRLVPIISRIARRQDCS